MNIQRSAMDLTVHPRIHKRHPNITETNVKAAFKNCFVFKQRDDDKFIGIGTDDKGRLLEIVFVQCDDVIVVFHAQTPPTKKTLTELKTKKGQ